MKYKNHILTVIMAFLIILAFFLGKRSAPVVDETTRPDINQYIRIIDSLKVLARRRKDTIEIEKAKVIHLDSLLESNKNKTNNEKDRIRKFTPTDRHRWNDSVLTANGLK